MKASDRGLALIREFEGCSLTPYLDQGGKPTIGIGHLIRKHECFTKIDEAEATRLLCEDVSEAEMMVDISVDVPLSQNQFDALVSIVFNVGPGDPPRKDGIIVLKSGKPSTLLRKLNSGDYAGCSEEFPKWCHVGPNESNGLIRRRLAEQLLFNTP